MNIGSTIPSEVYLWDNETDAMADWSAITGVANDTKPFYLKLAFKGGNKIEESYVCFERNNAQYCIKGGDSGASFLSNAKIIYDAFEGVGCYGDSNLPVTYDSTYNPNPTFDFSCGVSGLGASTSLGGYVEAYDIEYNCNVSSDGSSNCTQQEGK